MGRVGKGPGWFNRWPGRIGTISLDIKQIAQQGGAQRNGSRSMAPWCSVERADYDYTRIYFVFWPVGANSIALSCDFTSNLGGVL